MHGLTMADEADCLRHLTLALTLILTVSATALFLAPQFRQCQQSRQCQRDRSSPRELDLADKNDEQQSQARPQRDVSRNFIE